MEYFNIERYKDWELDTDHSSYAKRKFLKKANDRLEINLSTNSTFLRISNTLNQYTLYKLYFPNNSLEVVGREFNGFSIGKWQVYDETGKLTKEIDKDAPYKFSVDQLIKKMQKEYGLDINKKTKTMAVSRWESSELMNKPFYCVFYYLNDDSQYWKYILIDGSTGETLFTTLFVLNDYESLGPFYQYLELLEKKETEDNAYYKSYKGKDYTKKEWEIFEEEWHKNYMENKDKSFWDHVFPRRKEK